MVRTCFIHAMSTCSAHLSCCAASWPREPQGPASRRHGHRTTTDVGHAAASYGAARDALLFPRPIRSPVSPTIVAAPRGRRRPSHTPSVLAVNARLAPAPSSSHRLRSRANIGSPSRGSTTPPKGTQVEVPAPVAPRQIFWLPALSTAATYSASLSQPAARPCFLNFYLFLETASSTRLSPSLRSSPLCTCPSRSWPFSELLADRQAPRSSSCRDIPLFSLPPPRVPFDREHVSF